jgi:hypothetical protein
MSEGRTVCAACKRNIDAAARLCPYCGANPATGERLDTQAILQEIFRPREVSTSDSVMEFARQRQGVVIAVSVFIAFLIIGALHQFATMRNATAVTDAPAVALSEIADVTKRPDDTTPVPLPNLDFQYDGRPRTMRTFIVEQGAVTPPEVIAAQQAAAAAAKPQTPRPGQAPQPQPARPTPQPAPQPR